MRHITRLSALLVLPVVMLAGCGDDGEGADAGASGAAPASAEVTIKTFNFQPDPLTVDAGTTITFRNMDKIDHTVTAGTREAPEPERFDGQLPEQGATFELTLDEAGTYDYFCTVHPGEGMTGQVIVR